MDHAERQRLKQLANDSIIATFGQESNEAKLAQALESTIDELTTIPASVLAIELITTPLTHDPSPTARA